MSGQTPRYPPAFPMPHATGCTLGMTLRDWFAGQLLADIADGFFEFDVKRADHAAQIAYRFADAMLKERENHG